MSMLSLPTPKLEAWKYTHLARAAAQLPEGVASHAPSLQELEALLPVIAAPQQVWLGTKLVPELGLPLPAGCKLTPTGPRLAGPKEAPLDALDTLAVPQGWRLEITADLATPLLLVSAAHAPCWVLEVEVAPGVCAEVIEVPLAVPGQAGWQHQAVSLLVGEAATLTHSVLALLPDTAGRLHTRRQRLELAPRATYRGSLGSAGGGLLRSELHTTLTEATEYHFTSLSLPRAAQHHDVTLQTRHVGEGNTVVIRQRNLQLDESHAVFQGKFHVEAEAQRTNAYMHCHTLLLSDAARTSTKPELEIYADDVKCSHGAACGGLNPHQLFYLRARGLSEDAARALLVQGFADEFIAEFPAVARPVLAARVAQWLQGGSTAAPVLTDFGTDWLAYTKANPEERTIVREPGDDL